MSKINFRHFFGRTTFLWKVVSSGKLESRQIGFNGTVVSLAISTYLKNSFRPQLLHVKSKTQGKDEKKKKLKHSKKKLFVT